MLLELEVFKRLPPQRHRILAGAEAACLPVLPACGAVLIASRGGVSSCGYGSSTPPPLASTGSSCSRRRHRSTAAARRGCGALRGGGLRGAAACDAMRRGGGHGDWDKEDKV